MKDIATAIVLIVGGLATVIATELLMAVVETKGSVLEIVVSTAWVMLTVLVTAITVVIIRGEE